MLRKLGILLLVLLVVAIIGDTLVWFWAVRQLRAGWDQWLAAQRAQGWTVASSAPQAGGWPVAAQVTVPDLSLHGGETAIPGGVTWGTQGLVLRLAARRPRELQIATSGAQHLRVSHGPDIAYTAQRLDVTVPLEQRPGMLAVELQGAGIRAGLATDGSDSVSVAALQAQFVLHQEAGGGEPVATLVGTATGIGLPRNVEWALGRQIASLSLDATLNGPLPAARTPTAAAKAWRDDGGTISVHRVATQWGPLGLAASGMLRLDGALQPAGSANAQVTGYSETLNALAQHGIMRPSAALAATAVLSLFAQTPVAGGPAAVEVPLSLQDGVLSMQRVPLMRMPALDWPPS